MADKQTQNLDPTTPTLDDVTVSFDIASPTELKKTTWQAVRDLYTSYYDGVYATVANLALKANDSAVVHTTSNESIAGVKTFTSPLITNGAINFNAPEGFMVNGKIVPTVASGNLTLTLTGTSASLSATNPCYVMIGGVTRTITSDIVNSQPSGVNYLNMGSAEIATKEVDLFSYLVWNTATNSVMSFIARIPYAGKYSDFDVSNTTEKGRMRSAGTVPNTDDVAVNIGRFAATLSAGAGYTWSIPTYTASNLVQRPIYMADIKNFVPTITAGTSTGITNIYSKYEVNGRKVHCEGQINIESPQTTINTVTITVPFSTQNQTGFSTSLVDNGADVSSMGFTNGSSIQFKKIGNFTGFLVMRYSADYVI